jgi:hypothetical protein
MQNFLSFYHNSLKNNSNYSQQFEESKNTTEDLFNVNPNNNNYETIHDEKINSIKIQQFEQNQTYVNEITELNFVICKINNFILKIENPNSLQNIFNKILEATNEEFSYLKNEKTKELVKDFSELNEIDYFIPIKQENKIYIQYQEEVFLFEVNSDLNLLKKEIGNHLNKTIKIIADLSNENEKIIISDVKSLKNGQKYFAFENLSDL